MTDDSIAKKVLQNLSQIVEETGKEAVKQVGEMTTGIITGKELLGNIADMSDAELNKKKAEEERKKQQEMADLRSQMPGQGRDVEKEIEEIRKEKEEKEKQEARAEQQGQQQMQQQQMMAQPVFEPMGKPARGKQGGGGKKKKQQPDDEAMSQTNEFKGKVD